MALLVAAIGCFAVTQSLAYAMRGKNPALAHALAPYDGRTTAALAEQLFLQARDAGARERAALLAARALRQDPTAVAAVGTLGFQAQVKGDAAGARRLFAYAETLSRRDLQTQLWAIEDAVGRGNVAEALRHYDIALRTSKKASDVLYPVLAAAIAEPAIRTNLVATLARQPAWGPSFVDFAAGKGADPMSIADLFVALRRAGVGVSDEATAQAINGLIGAGRVDAAWRYYALVRPGADRRQSRDPRFTAELTTPSVFDWTPINDGNVSTSIQRGPTGGIFDFAVPASGGGILLQQVQLLPPGLYRLEGHSSGVEQPKDSLPYWVLTCRGGQEAGRVVVSNSAQSSGKFAGQFRITPSCPLQTLFLVARPSDMVSGLSGQIDRVRLVPAG